MKDPNPQHPTTTDHLAYFSTNAHGQAGTEHPHRRTDWRDPLGLVVNTDVSCDHIPSVDCANN